MKTETVKLSQIQVNGANPRTISNEKFEKLINSVLVLPKMLDIRHIVVDDTMTVLGGNMRYRALVAISEMTEEDIIARLDATRDYKKKTDAERGLLIAWWREWLKAPFVDIIRAANLSADEQREFIIKDNASFGSWDMDVLANEWDSQDLDDWGLDVWQDNSDGDNSKSDNSSPANASLNDRFVVPPFSILDTRKGYWQARKKMWRELIGDMGESRNDTILHSPEVKYKDLYQRTRKHREELGLSFKEYLEKYVPNDVLEKEAQNVVLSGVSLFDPVLTEIMAKWFTPRKESKIFDCFAGDTYKGLVFAMCGHSFRGIELRKEQVDINNRIIGGRELDIEYICDDGQNVGKHIDADSQDLLFSCPPYFDLEHYSNLENDASNQKSYNDFIQILHNAFTAAIGCLKENRFAVIVVGDVRDKRTGFYYDFCGDIKRIFKEGGMSLYNELILVETAASTAMRAGRYMESRKVAKMHQNILIFYKGNPKDIKKYFPKIEFTQDELALFDKEQGGEDETKDLEV